MTRAKPQRDMVLRSFNTGRSGYYHDMSWKDRQVWADTCDRCKRPILGHPSNLTPTVFQFRPVFGEDCPYQWVDRYP